MKKFVKGLFIGLGALFALIIVVGVIGMNGKKEDVAVEVVEKAPEQKKVEVVAEEPKELPYDEILVGDALTGEGGMTYEEVLEVMGKEPKTHTSNEMEVSGVVTKTDMRTWVEGKSGVTVMFKNGLASSKTKVDY